MTTILETINSPADLKKLSMPELKQLANELRTFIIDNVSKTGGHLSSSGNRRAGYRYSLRV